MQKAEVRLCFVFGGRNSSIRGAISEVKKMKVITALSSASKSIGGRGRLHAYV
jgi:hypothetical protein